MGLLKDMSAIFSMISRTWLKACATIAFAVLLSGCATTPQADLLDVKLVNLRFAKSRVLETDAVFTIRIENESPETVRITGGVYKFYLDGSMVGKGMSNETIEVPRLSSVTQEVTVHLGNFTMARKIQPIIQNKRVNTKADSLLYCEAGGRQQKVKVIHETMLDVRDFVPEAGTATPIK